MGDEMPRRGKSDEFDPEARVSRAEEIQRQCAEAGVEAEIQQRVCSDFGRSRLSPDFPPFSGKFAVAFHTTFFSLFSGLPCRFL